tara:strand:+ start:173 stop:865 length:693 start_codon:yes stop_codon:yes gene_type:complete
MLFNKKIIALVPARGGSKGIKFKNLKKIKDKTLVQITSEFIDKCSFIDLKVLSSDNKKIIEHGKKLNYEIVKRNKKLGDDKISDYQVIFHALNYLKKKNKYNFDYVIYLQPTSPIRKKSHLKETLKKLIKQKYDSAWSVSKVSLKYHPLKSLIINDKKLKLFDKKGKKIIARQMLYSSYIRNGVFYIFNIKKFLKEKTIYLKKILPSMTNYKVVNIDNKEDLKKAAQNLN